MNINTNVYNLSEIEITEDEDIYILNNFAKENKINGIKISDNEIVIKEELDDFICNHPDTIKEYNNITDMIENESCCYIFTLK